MKDVNPVECCSLSLETEGLLVFLQAFLRCVFLIDINERLV